MSLSEVTMFVISHQQQIKKPRKARKIRAMEMLQLQDREARVIQAAMGVMMKVAVPTQVHPLPHLLLPVPLKPMLTVKL